MTSQSQFFKITTWYQSQKKEYFLLFTGISIVSTRNLLGLTANIKSDIFISNPSCQIDLSLGFRIAQENMTVGQRTCRDSN